MVGVNRASFEWVEEIQLKVVVDSEEPIKSGDVIEMSSVCTINTGLDIEEGIIKQYRRLCI